MLCSGAVTWMRDNSRTVVADRVHVVMSRTQAFGSPDSIAATAPPSLGDVLTVVRYSICRIGVDHVGSGTTGDDVSDAIATSEMIRPGLPAKSGTPRSDLGQDVVPRSTEDRA